MFKAILPKCDVYWTKPTISLFQKFHIILHFFFFLAREYVLYTTAEKYKDFGFIMFFDPNIFLFIPIMCQCSIENPVCTVTGREWGRKLVDNDLLSVNMHV